MIRDDLAAWQRLNVCAFLMSGVIAAAGPEAIGEDYLDADGNRHLPLLVQLAGIALRAPHRDADAVLRALSRHP